jgi:hypothetical protein
MPNLYVGDRGEPVVIPRPPPPLKYNPGPPSRGSYAGTRTTSAGHPAPPPQPPPDIFANYTGPQVDAAKQMVQQFMTLLGYPQGVDLNQLMLQLLSGNLLGDPQAAAQFLYTSGMGVTEAMRQASPWAQFGLDAGSFHTRRDTIDSTFESLIGRNPEQLGAGEDSLRQLYHDAIRSNWGQQELLQRLQSDPGFTDLRAAQPWLSAGQGEQQVSQQFASLYGSAPVDASALAGWFRFNTGAQQLNRTAREAIAVATPQPSTSETR